MGTRKRRGRGEGSIYQTADGRWVGSISLGYDAQGKRRRPKVTGASKQEVQEKLARLQQRGPSAAAVPQKMGEYLATWLEGMRPNVAVSTFERREDILRLHVLPYLGTVSLSGLQPVHVERFYAELYRLGQPAATRRAAAGLLTAALRRAVRLKLIPFNPADGVDKPRAPSREMQVLDEGQVRTVLEQAPAGRWRTLFTTAVGTGMRIGELFGLHWKDIDFRQGTLFVRQTLSQSRQAFTLREPKTRAGRRRIVLPSFALAALEEHRKAQLAAGLIDAPVFCTRTGGFLQRQNFYASILRPLIKRAGLPPFRFHDLRHTHASHLLSKGSSIRAVASRLGHSRPEMTLRVYAHVLPNDDHTLAGAAQALFG